MNLLAFDTSTDTMSVAVSRFLGGAARVWEFNGLGGAPASASLIPAIRDLMARAEIEFADLHAIAFGRGPGAFTGLRTACSVAQGLGFGAQAIKGGPGVPLLPIDTLLALAEQARHARSELGRMQVLAMLDARMDQIYAANYAFDGLRWQPLQDCSLVSPEGVECEPGSIMAGNVFAAYGQRLPGGPDIPRVFALPSAAAMLRLAPALLACGHGVSAELALPLYIRDKVAQTSAERAGAKARNHHQP